MRPLARHLHTLGSSKRTNHVRHLVRCMDGIPRAKQRSERVFTDCTSFYWWSADVLFYVLFSFFFFFSLLPVTRCSVLSVCYLVES